VAREFIRGSGDFIKLKGHLTAAALSGDCCGSMTTSAGRARTEKLLSSACC